MARQSLIHSARAAFSMKGSLRTRLSSAPVCSRTILSSTGRTSLETESLTPAIGSTTSTTLTWAVRLGASRQLDAMVGCDMAVTVPRKSAC